MARKKLGNSEETARKQRGNSEETERNQRDNSEELETARNWETAEQQIGTAGNSWKQPRNMQLEKLDKRYRIDSLTGCWH